MLAIFLIGTIVTLYKIKHVKRFCELVARSYETYKKWVSTAQKLDIFKHPCMYPSHTRLLWTQKRLSPQRKKTSSSHVRLPFLGQGRMSERSGVQFNRYFRDVTKPLPNHALSFETCLKLKCPCTEVVPKAVPEPHSKSKMSIESLPWAVRLRGVVAALHRVVCHEAGEVSPTGRPLLLLALAEGAELAQATPG